MGIKLENMTQLQMRQWFALNDRDGFDLVYLKASLRGGRLDKELETDLAEFGCKHQDPSLVVVCVLDDYCPDCLGLRGRK